MFLWLLSIMILPVILIFLYIAFCQNDPNVQGTYHCDHLVGEL